MGRVRAWRGLGPTSALARSILSLPGWQRLSEYGLLGDDWRLAAADSRPRVSHHSRLRLGQLSETDGEPRATGLHCERQRGPRRWPQGGLARPAVGRRPRGPRQAGPAERRGARDARVAAGDACPRPALRRGWRHHLARSRRAGRRPSCAARVAAARDGGGPADGGGGGRRWRRAAGSRGGRHRRCRRARAWLGVAASARPRGPGLRRAPTRAAASRRRRRAPARRGADARGGGRLCRGRGRGCRGGQPSAAHVARSGAGADAPAGTGHP